MKHFSVVIKKGGTRFPAGCVLLVYVSLLASLVQELSDVLDGLSMRANSFNELLKQKFVLNNTLICKTISRMPASHQIMVHMARYLSCKVLPNSGFHRYRVCA